MCLQSQRCLSEENLSLFVPAVSPVGHLLSCPQQGSIKKIKIYLQEKMLRKILQEC